MNDHQIKVEKEFKTVVITGASRGLGYALVQLLCSKKYNYRVIITSRNLEKMYMAYHHTLTNYGYEDGSEFV